MRFKSTRRGVEAKLEPAEAALLAQCASELLTLLGEPEQASADPLDALVGLPAGEATRPADPALARLFPDAYGEDADAASDFRRYTESDLRAGKRAHAAAVRAGVEPLVGSGGRLVLDPAGTRAWLGWLTDLRLVLGTRLDVTEDPAASLPSDPAEVQLLAIYSWLGGLQESLLGCVQPTPDS